MFVFGNLIGKYNILQELRFGALYSANAITGLCAALANETWIDDFEAFALWIREHYDTTKQCLEVNFVDHVWLSRQEDWSIVTRNAWAEDAGQIWPFTSRPQLWLQCTQLAGAWTNVNSESSMFGHHIGQDLFFSMCTNVFPGGQYEWNALAGAVSAVGRRYGGRQARVSRVLYTNGELDARAPFGVLGSEYDVLVIPGCGQSADLHAIGSSDAIELVQAKQRVVQTVKNWLREC